MQNDFIMLMRSNVEGLMELMREANEFLETLSLPPRAVYKANLVLEEILTNTIKYGFKDTSEHEIRVLIAPRDAELIIEFVDDGHEFNPLSLSPPKVNESIGDRDAGGLGIHLVRKTVEWMEYRRDQGKNVLKVGIKWNS